MIIKNKKGIAGLEELIIAILVGTILLGGMTFTMVRFLSTHSEARERFAQSQEARVALAHLDIHIKGSAYVEMTGGTLRLFDNSETQTGVYDHDPGWLRFSVAGVVEEEFPGVIATFSDRAGVTGKIIATKITFTSPFSLHSVMTCRLGVPLDTWIKEYDANDNERFAHVLPVSDGGYLFFGWTDAYTGGVGNHPLILKTNSIGEVIWSKVYQNSYNDPGQCEFSSVQELPNNGGFIIQGRIRDSGGVMCAMLLKIDSFGNVQWARDYRDSDSAEGIYFMDIQRTFDNTNTPDGYILAGYGIGVNQAGIQSGLLIKTDLMGNVTWARSYSDGTASPFFGLFLSYVRQTDDDPIPDGFLDGYILLGSTKTISGHPTNDAGEFVLVKVTAAGATTWARTYGWDNSVTREEVGWNGTLELATNGDIVFGGLTRGATGSSIDFAVIKASGVPADIGLARWARVYGGNNFERLRTIQKTQDNGYILGGDTQSWGGTRYLLIKTDNSLDQIAEPGGGIGGAVQWARRYRYQNGCIRQVTDGSNGYIRASAVLALANDGRVIRTDAAGDIDPCTIASHQGAGDPSIPVALSVDQSGTATLVQDNLLDPPPPANFINAVETANIATNTPSFTVRNIDFGATIECPR
jgi:hypothetical protein